ncbi:MAG: YbjN domain-containing protein [Cyclobacteriaceae bacterium]|nr:YbjN domain-containing protein [Cyclobacteriaceae bacterium]
MKNYAQEIDGQYSEYNDTVSIIIVPLFEDRFQTVFGEVTKYDRYDKEVIEFSSKVCEYEEGIDLKSLMEENHNFCYGKFSILNGYIQVKVTFFKDNVKESTFKQAIQEIANLADEYEFKLTGADVH